MRGRNLIPINLVSAMSGAPPATTAHASDLPASQPVLPAASQPLVPDPTPGRVTPSTGPPSGARAAPAMTNEQLTQGFFRILQRLDVMATSMQTLQDGQWAIRQALLTGHPGLQQLPLPSPTTAAAFLPCPPAPTPVVTATVD
ncbi:hypothetical protein GUJ93_ZPchr0010g10494 [Zizania palustris]|uniref:Uncharacterized protein n=1 Tax=Zizania palustris TaxID=103762 RepID=A0A8J5W869_ZIZPA|nr:hypothetical protein GUJ93_ZPchr0010g10494 [Zizania palustris]